MSELPGKPSVAFRETAYLIPQADTSTTSFAVTQFFRYAGRHKFGARRRTPSKRYEFCRNIVIMIS
jgi:hypothetical protein